MYGFATISFTSIVSATYSKRMNMSRAQEGSVNPLVISNALLAVLVIAFGSLMVWAYVNYQDQKNNVDAKIAVAVASAKKEEASENEKNFLEREKAPYEKYTGSADLGNVTFNYPKTWSVYQAKIDGSGMEAYLHPGVVPLIAQGQQFATEVKVLDQSSDQLLKRYDSLVKKGDLKSSQVVINGFPGTRLDGRFSDKITGSLVIFKLRDKTLTLATDADTFKPDFDNVILKSLDFNP